MVVTWALIDPNFRRGIDCTHDYVETPISVQVTDSGSPMPGRGARGQPRFGGQSGEFHPAIVRRTNVAKNCVRLFHHYVRCGQKRLNVPARNKNILPAVVVEIGDRGRITGHRHALAGHAARFGHFDESSLASVAIDGEGFIVQSDQDNVGIAIIIEIAEIDAHAGDEDAVLAQRDISVEPNLVKRATFVSKEPIEQLIIGNKEVHLAVKVKIGCRPSHTLPWVCAETPFDRGIPECPVSVVDE